MHTASKPELLKNQTQGQSLVTGHPSHGQHLLMQAPKTNMFPHRNESIVKNLNNKLLMAYFPRPIHFCLVASLSPPEGMYLQDCDEGHNPGCSGEFKEQGQKLREVRCANTFPRGCDKKSPGRKKRKRNIPVTGSQPFTLHRGSANK
jgi:hypothetical protein